MSGPCILIINKKVLKGLVKSQMKFFKRIVSFFAVSGHDSKEDAASCMELMMWKIKEDATKLARS